jgi:type IV pilus assembly protein PilM
MFDYKKLLSLDFFKRKRKQSAVGIDIGSSSIKIVQIRNKDGAAILETYGELALGPYAGTDIGLATSLSADQIAEALQDLIHESNVTSTEVGMSMPFAASLITVIQFPAVSQGQLEKMVPIEARKYIPVPINEVVMDWFVVPSEESVVSPGGKQKSKQEEEKAAKKTPRRKVEVLLVAIHNDILNRYGQIIKKTKLKSSFSEIEIFSTMRATLGQGIKPTMIIDMGATTTKVFIVEYGIVKVSHVINRGSQDLTTTISRSLNISIAQAEEGKRKNGLLGGSEQEEERKTMLFVLENVLTQSNRVLLKYQKQYNKNVARVILTGGGAVLKGVLDLAQRHFETSVVTGDPFAKLETPEFLRDVLKEVGPEFAVAVGLAIRKLQESS